GGEIKPERLASNFTKPEQQLVEIAKAIGALANGLIMDETTACFTESEGQRLFTVIARLCRPGVCVGYILHRLEEISSIADRITVLRDGETVGTLQKVDADRQRLISMMVGREVTAVAPKGPVSAVSNENPILEVFNLRNTALGLNDISFSVR